MPKKFKIETVRINRLAEHEYDIIVPSAGLDAHIRYEGNLGWNMDVFEGTSHVDLIACGRCKDHGPDWTEILDTLFDMIDRNKPK